MLKKMKSFLGKKKICMVTTSTLNYDTRILNEAETIASWFHLTILKSANYQKKNFSQKTPYRVKSISFPQIPYFKTFLSRLTLTIAAFREDTDIYHAHDLEGLICAYLPALLKRKILIYDSHELWTQVATNGYFGKISLIIRIILEKLFVTTKVNKIITVNESLANILEKMYHKPVLSLYNYPVISKAKKDNNFLRYEFGQKVIIYLGGLSKGRGLKYIIQATKYLDDSYVLLIIGYGPLREELINMINCGGYHRVKICPAISPKCLIQSISGANVGFCLIEPISLSYFHSTPNKLFQYIAAEIPILTSNFPEMKKIVLDNGIGEVTNPRKPKLIAKKIIEMTCSANQIKYKKNLKGLAKKKYNWALEAKKLIKFYDL